MNSQVETVTTKLCKLIELQLMHVC